MILVFNVTDSFWAAERKCALRFRFLNVFFFCNIQQIQRRIYVKNPVDNNIRIIRQYFDMDEIQIRHFFGFQKLFCELYCF